MDSRGASGKWHVRRTRRGTRFHRAYAARGISSDGPEASKEGGARGGQILPSGKRASPDLAGIEDTTSGEPRIQAARREAPARVFQPRTTARGPRSSGP